MSTPDTTRKLTVDLDLLRKYSRPAPGTGTGRIAPHFHTGFGPEDLRREILATDSAPDPPDLSLYLHVPFCRSLCTYCGCTVVVSQDEAQIADYLDDLLREIDLLAELVSDHRRTVQVQWGGGTPTDLSPRQIRDVCGHVRRRFSLADDAEVGIEIDPRGLGPDHLPTLREVGFTDVCFGVQDLDPEVQRAVNRSQSEELTRRCLEDSRALGFHTVAVDLIYGLPYQTVASFRTTLEKIIDLDPDRISVFRYGHIPRLKPHQRALEKLPMPDAEQLLELFKMIIETLTEEGYVYIGMDQFTKPDDALARAQAARTLTRNLQGYGTHPDTDLHGLGLTGISHLQSVFAQNTKVLPSYTTAVAAGTLPTSAGCRLDDEDRLRGHLVRELVCNYRIDKRSVERRFAIDFDAHLSNLLERAEELVHDGLLEVAGDHIEVCDPGRPLIRTIAGAFCRRLWR
jgi:oxygen-independent coproporphyrinogen-3 oxidase